MSWFKRNLRFGGALLVCGFALGTELWLWRAARQQAGRALVALERKTQERDSLAGQSPALSAANEHVITQDLGQTARVLAGLRAVLQPRDRTPPGGLAPTEPIDAYFALAAFVEKTRTLAAHAQVVLKPDERFSFAAHANEGPEAELVPAVFRQRLAAQFLMEALLEARPGALLSVQRERPLAATQRTQRNQPGQAGVPAGAASTAGGGATADFFEYDAQNSLRQPGRIESEAFRLEFTGQTPVLRALLNRLASSAQPVIVRRVEVERLTAGTATTVSAAAGTPVPLVSGNLSKFAVVVECVELLPPSTP